jgi:TonB family protein
MAAEPSVRIKEAEAKKCALVRPMPVYPAVARQLNLAGRVEMEAIIAEDGSVEEARGVLGNPVLTKAAAEALKKWHFTPFQENGKPVRVVASLSFEFKQ